MKLRLHHILFAAFTAIAAIPVVLLALWVQQWSLSQEISAVEEKHLLVARNLTHALSRYVADVRTIFGNISLELSEGDSSDTHAALLSGVHITRIWLTDQDGRPTVSLATDPAYPTGHTPQELLGSLAGERERASRTPGTVVFSNLLADGRFEPSIALLEALPDRRFAIAILSTEYVQQVQRRIAFGDKGHAAIVDRMGRVMAHPLDSWRSSMKDISAISAVQAMMQGRTGVTTFYSPAMKADMIAGYTTVPGVGWGVMVPQPISELAARTTMVRMIASGIALLGMVIAAFIAWRLSGLLARPIAEVAASAHDVADGHFATRVSLRQRLLPSELHELSDAFNHMVKQISTKTKALKISTRRLAEAQRIARMGNWEWDIRREQFWHSKEIATIFGHPRKQRLSRRKLLAQVHPDDLDTVNETSEKVLTDHQPRNLEYRIILPDGSLWHLYQKTDIIVGNDDRPRQLMGSLRDITEHKHHQQQLEWQANHDELTKLPNRHAFTHKLAQSLAKASKKNTRTALFYIDLDDVSAINNSLGYTAGDDLLKIAAERLQATLPEGCVIARESGDEFVVMASGIEHPEETDVIATFILSAFSTSFLVEGYEVFTGCNIGISVYPTDAEDAKTLLRNAHIATRIAKEAGRNSYQHFTEQMHHCMQRRISLRNELRTALSRNELEVLYQPIIDTTTGSVHAAEALLRWHHPSLGDISPTEFIPLAEETGVIVALGNWVLEQACAECVQWNLDSDHPVRISVNLSARQVQLGLKPSDIGATLRRRGLEPGLLSLEITESLILDDTEDVIQWLQEARSLGIHFSMDDFGTGYSSLSYLTRIPTDTLKIDRSFIRDMASNPDNLTLLKTIIAMARSLNLKVIVEGVEDRDQLRILEAQGCHLIQGYLFSKPVPAGSLSRLLRDPSAFVTS